MDILKTLSNVLDSEGIGYFVDYGTLLGFIRENGFIKTDDDIDVTICDPNVDVYSLVQRLIASGFVFIHALMYHGRTRIVSVALNGISIDLYFRELSPDNSVYWCYGAYFDAKFTYPGEEWNSCKRVAYPLSLQPEKYMIQGIQTYVPHDAEAHLVFEYGRDWRIPDAKCKGSSEKKVEIMPDFVKRIISLEEFYRG